jgi:hypothetical protein
MPDALAGIAIVAASAVVAFLEPRLDGLIDPIETDAVTQIELDTMEERTINWVLPALVRRLAPSGEVFPRTEVERIRESYDYNMFQIQAARSWHGEFDHAKRNLRRLLVGGILTFVPLGAIVAAPVPADILTYVAVILISLAVAFMSAAGYAYSSMRRGRKHYRAVTNGLKERLAAQSVSEIRGDNEAQQMEGENHS